MKLRLLAVAALTSLAALPLRAATNFNDTARFLAGMPVGGDSALAQLTQDPAWKQHAAYFNTAWAKLESRQLSKVRTWAGGNLRGRTGNVFYMFSGPDFLYADAFFPGARNYVLCGIEPVGSVPDVTKLALGPALYQIEGSLNSVLNYSFFQTKEMRQDFSASQLNGTLPVLMVFMARCGKTDRKYNARRSPTACGSISTAARSITSPWTCPMARSRAVAFSGFAAGWAAATACSRAPRICSKGAGFPRSATSCSTKAT